MAISDEASQRYDMNMNVHQAYPALWNRALQIFGSEEKVSNWLHTPLAELDERTPEAVLNEDPNTEDVDAVLDRIEYGVFS
jgi:putative toxin-antitoxin system antitoxin component (TIGR02293 family)